MVVRTSRKDPATVSKWCTNTMQPNLETLVAIAKALDVDVKDLLWSIKKMKYMIIKHSLSNVVNKIV